MIIGLILCAFALLVPLNGHAQSEEGTRIEGIVAVVGSELILLSELNDLVAYELAATGISDPPDTLVDRLQTSLLEQLIDDRLLLSHARERDIQVDEEEVEQALQERIDQIRSRFPSESAFIAQLEAEGIEMSTFRSLQRRAVEEQLLKYRLQETLRDEWRIQITEMDVQRFCAERSDEIPDSPERVEAHHILLTEGPDPQEMARQDSLLRAIRKKIDGGETFSSMASKYSEDGSASLGGDLGTFQKGAMVPEFEEALDALEPGEISGVVTTRFGLHLIQLIDRDDRSYQARHIIRLLKADSDAEQLVSRAAEIKAASDSIDLDELARKYSADPDTRENGGLIGTVAPVSIRDETVAAVLDTLLVDTLSEPIVQDDGLHLYWVTKRIPAGKPSCDEIADGIRDLLFREKLETRLQELLDQLREETYINMRM